MSIRRRFPACPLASLAMLALGACSSAGTSSVSYDIAEATTNGTIAPATSPGGAAGDLRVVNGFLVDIGPPRPVDPAGRYYVNFYSRWLSVYGHTYVVYGRLDNSGKPLDRHFAALYPRGGYLGLTAGSLPLMVPATTLPLEDDRTFGTIAVYHREINAAQYEKIETFVYEARSRANVWNLYTLNCNYFAGQVAEAIGLRAPPLSAQITPMYVKELELLNGDA